MANMPHSSRLATLALLLSAPMLARGDDDFERAPINYSKARPDNAVERLQAKLDAGTLRLSFHQERGYLDGLVKLLNVPESSQVLVFSKTSLQRSRISPKTPRALYFSDEVYVGYCQRGQVVEISAVDPKLGTVFYTLDQQETERPRFQRQTNACLLCHGSSQTRNVPGHTLRSVYTDRYGEALLSMGSVRVDQSTAFDRRWGGWYVTGSHGKQRHLGNLIVENQRDRETIANNPKGQNRSSLKDFLDTAGYLTPHSDIVSLMVLEHQTEAHNLIARAGIQTRLALHQQMQLNKELGEAPDHQWQSTRSRIKSVGEPLVRYLLFSGEAKLTDSVRGTSTFAADFAKKSPRDLKGRSLRDFDLERRLFKYPCSYLIYSDAFDQLPAAMKAYVYECMYDVFTHRDRSEAFSHLSDSDRQALLEILRDTKSDLPDYWRK